MTKRTHMKNATGFLWVEAGEAKEGLVAEVAVVLPLGHTYSFAVPPTCAGLQIGQRVTVPLGRMGRASVGFVVGLDRRPWDSTLRPVASVVDEQSFLTADLVKLGREISEHYVCPLGPTLKAMTPEAVRRRRGLVKVRYLRLVRPLSEILAEPGRRSRQQTAVLETLAATAAGLGWAESLRLARVTGSVVHGLVAKGWVECTVRYEPRADANESHSTVEPTFELTQEQNAALAAIHEAIDAARFSVTLLYGVSGSGKTEVYVRAIRRVVEGGRQAILLVPEILLTTQLMARLASRFANAAVMHSGTTETQRADVWRQVATGGKSVVVGTMSAAFAPCPNLGLICVDEEQESSYKSLRAPRFHARTVALMRGKQLGIPIVLGSATPSLETWHDATRRADHQRVVLTRRVKELPLPKVHLVNMEDEFDEVKRPVVLSRTMERLLGETLGRGEQAIILMNRRGYAHRIYCPGCRTRITCPNCSVGLVVHTAVDESICHYCRSRIPTPTHCPNVTCGEKLLRTGLGTQRVEEILGERFPRTRIQRVDRDTMVHRRQYQRVVDDFERRKIDVLVGTQMIAKGLDFPFVSFVGVVNADAVALAVDFRAHERLFQLITQVAGRAGRADAPGQVVVQTQSAELPALRFALHHDYVAFAEAELTDRERVGLPPFRSLARVVFIHGREETSRGQAEATTIRIASAISSLRLSSADVLGPNPCALSRLRGAYRYDLLIRTNNAFDLRRLMHHLDQAGAFRTKADATQIDVDPVSLT